MSIIVITDDTTDHGPGSVRADFKGPTDIAFEATARIYTETAFRAYQVSGIQPADFDTLVELNLKNLPEEVLAACDWSGLGMDADLGRHLMTSLFVYTKLQLAHTVHAVGVDDVMCAWVAFA
jgi:hypothetical protein